MTCPLQVLAIAAKVISQSGLNARLILLVNSIPNIQTILGQVLESQEEGVQDTK